MLIAQGSTIGHGLSLAPTVSVSSDVRSIVGSWAPNVASLTIVVIDEPLDCSVLQDELAASDLTSLKSVYVEWDEEVDDEQWDRAVAAIMASRPHLCHLEPKRARVEAAPWMLPPIVLHMVRCLETTKEVLAFLHALPSDACDEPLEALVMLLTHEPGMWPDVVMGDVPESYIPIKALPALRALHCAADDDFNYGGATFCARTPLPPTIDVYVSIMDVRYLRSSCDTWLANVVDLTTARSDEDAQDLQQQLGACPRLTALTIEWQTEMSQNELDDVMAAIAASCPGLSALGLSTCSSSILESCESLLKWLARPIAKSFKLSYMHFPKLQADALMQALSSSPSLESIKLQSDLTRGKSIVRPSALWQTPHLRHLTIDAHNINTTHIISWDDTTCLAFPPTLRSFRVYNTQMANFPPLPELQSLTLGNTSS
ncbi:hypothetical protein SPRG_09312 [Saprolegnia parasitica CBS 223.65]|uniref:Uncharacterized protein n=1 Tax=Saprolegnia parasitica (strain CBS 223.65) TaxID=695850 RepID=A0A067CFP5_SAPPC|nr:hypothetical protein SPRG_09312 [Saprolegnia parasitica CBS 223.65]KDO25371.1 hypothetical protein SPRG_09312 [Saprolegnia parasitica CBS 223.65]|eukprot:XP_012203799.1 hypothetical protein SPRG_09312 [Saprolegnia parasitica CBS 223.65]